MQNKKIKVAVLKAKYGGPVVTSIDDTVIGLDRGRFEVTFIYLVGNPACGNHLRDKGLDVHYLSSGKRKFAAPLIILRLARFLKTNRFDILHCHAHKASQYGALAGFFLPRLKVFSQVHGLGRSERLRRKIANYLFLRRINRFLAVAGAVKDDLVKNNWGIRPDKVTVLENSVDCRKFAQADTSKKDARRTLQIPADAFVFGTVGRLAQTKGLSYLINAFAQVHQEHPRSYSLLVGQGPEEASCRELVRSLGIEKAVCFGGFHKNIEKVYPAIDVFVLSSIAEGMPRVLLEAMSAGIPCIGTRVGGIPEIVDRHMLVEPKDAAALAAAMTNLIVKSDQELKAIASHVSQKVQQNFSHAVVTEKLASIYLEVLNRTKDENSNSVGSLCGARQVY